MLSTGIFCGHIHQEPEAVVAGGVPVYTTPSTMAQILPLSMEYRLDSRPPGFRVVELLRSESSRVGAGGADNATMRTRVVRLEAPTAVLALRPQSLS